MKILKYGAVVFLLFIAYNLITTFNKLKKSVITNVAPLPKITSQYLDLFSKKSSDMLTPSYTYFNNYKSPIGTFKTVDERYRLVAKFYF